MRRRKMATPLMTQRRESLGDIRDIINQRKMQAIHEDGQTLYLKFSQSSVKTHSLA
jgi:hypothetical protein